MAETKITKKYPIVFHENYDIKFWGFENLHVFDSRKWGKVLRYVIGNSNKVTKNNIFTPEEVSEEDLLVGHSQTYLSSLESSYNVARIVEVALVALIPNSLVKGNLLKKFRYHVGGTILAAKLALEYRQSFVNIGGGFHHASRDRGMGFCVYADISIAIKLLQKPDRKFMIIDLDAHQGNGHETDFQSDDNVFIFDMYNEYIYPHDREAKKGIRGNVPLTMCIKDDEYMEKLKSNLNECFKKFHPDLIIYNAGTDCLLGDPLGRMNITDEGIIERDEIVFQKATERKCPVVMVTSGGYQKSNADIIGRSICNLMDKGYIKEVNEDNALSNETEEINKHNAHSNGTENANEDVSKTLLHRE